MAVWPPDDVLDRVDGLDRPPRAGLRWTTRDQWHVTLRFLGPVADIDPVVAALAGLSSLSSLSWPGEPGERSWSGELSGPGDAVLGPTVGRFGHRVLHVPVAGLDALAAEVVDATAHLGRPPDPRAFAGHLTLARVAKGARVDLRTLAGAPLAARWSVAELCLVESRLYSAGARYRIVARFPRPLPLPRLTG